MSKKFDEIEKKFMIQEARSRALGSLVDDTNRKVNRQESNIHTLEAILVRAGILVEIKAEPPLAADVTIQHTVWNEYGTATIPHFRNYKVVIPNQQKGATVGPRSEGSK